jgi:hypothetical protein
MIIEKDTPPVKTVCQFGGAYTRINLVVVLPYSVVRCGEVSLSLLFALDR